MAGAAPHKGRSQPSLGLPNPPEKLRLSWAAREKFTPRISSGLPAPALNRNSPECCHRQRAKAEPPKFSCFDLNSTGSLEANTAWRTCLSARAAAALEDAQVQGRGLSSGRVRPRSGSQKRNSSGKGGPGPARGDAVSEAAGSSQARGRKGSGVYFSSSKTCRSRT